MARDIQNPTEFRITRMDMSGGENNAVDALKIGPTQFSKVKDLLYDEIGNLLMRDGTSTIAFLSGGSNPVRSLGAWKSSLASIKYVCSALTKVYKKSGISLIEILDGVVSNAICSYESYDNRLYICSGGTVKVIESDESTRNAGCIAPTVAPTIALDGAGAYTGVVRYAYSWLYPWGESPISPITSTISPSSQKVLVTCAAYPSTAVGIKIYRTINGGTIPLLLTTLTSPTNTYSDQLSDGSLGIASVDNSFSVSNPTWMKIYKNYAYYVSGIRFWYSRLAYPDQVPAAAWDEPLKDLDNSLMAIDFTLNPSFLVMFFSKSILAYSGTSPFLTESNPLVKLEINRNLGTKSPHTIQRVNGDLVFMANDSMVYSISRVSLAATETIEPEPISNPIRYELENNINTAMLSKFHAVYNDRKYFLYVATKTSTVLDRVWICDLSLPDKPWSHAEPSDCLCAGIIDDADGIPQVSMGAADSTKIYQFLSGKDDNGTLINPELVTGKISLGYPFHRKTHLTIRILGEAAQNYRYLVRVYMLKNGKLKFEDFVRTGLSSVSVPGLMWGQGSFLSGQWTSNTLISNVITEIKAKIRVNNDCDILWIRITDVTSGSIFKIKGYEITGMLNRAR